MKVHNFGSDYAYQKKLKEQENQPMAVMQQPETTIKSEENVGDQVSGRREGSVTDTSTKAISEKTKNKKKTRSEIRQPENDC